MAYYEAPSLAGKLQGIWGATWHDLWLEPVEGGEDESEAFTGSEESRHPKLVIGCDFWVELDSQPRAFLWVFGSCPGSLFCCELSQFYIDNQRLSK